MVRSPRRSGLGLVVAAGVAVADLEFGYWQTFSLFWEARTSKGEGGDGISELKPAVVPGEGVGDSFEPPAEAEGVGLEGDADPGDGDGHLEKRGWMLMEMLM